MIRTVQRIRLARRLGQALALGLALSLLFGGWVWARTPITVRVLMPAPFADATAGLVTAFNREHRDLRIAVTRGPFETESVSDLAVSSLLLGDSPYDLLLMDVTWTAKYAAAGWLLPLDPWLGPEALEALAPGARAGNRIDGQLWRLPLVADMGLLYWRTDLMPAPPRTPADLVSVAQRLQADGKVRWGYVWQGRQYEGLSCVFLEMVEGFGGRWSGTEGNGMGLDQPPATAAATWLQNLVAKGVTPAAVGNFAEPQALQSFEAGEAAFMRNWGSSGRSATSSGSSNRASRVGVYPHSRTSWRWLASSVRALSTVTAAAG